MEYKAQLAELQKSLKERFEIESHAKADNQLKAEENKMCPVDVSKKLDEQMTRKTRVS